MFFKKMTYIENHGRCSFKSIIHSLTNDTFIEPMQNYEWNDTSSSFTLPSLPHSSYGSCRIMIKEYFLRLQVSIFDSKPFHLDIPITIGNFILISKIFVNEKRLIEIELFLFQFTFFS
jgi:hypothetical protein